MMFKHQFMLQGEVVKANDQVFIYRTHYRQKVGLSLNQKKRVLRRKFGEKFVIFDKGVYSFARI